MSPDHTNPSQLHPLMEEGKALAHQTMVFKNRKISGDLETARIDDFIPSKRRRGRVWCCWLPWISTFLFVVIVLTQASNRPNTTHEHQAQLYSPAEEAVEYELRKFHLGFDADRTEFQGPPSPELDAAWNRLYGDGIPSLIPQDQAAKLPNKTVIFPHDPQRRYMVSLDVFHQLHCLNMIRQAFHPEYYKMHMPVSADIDPEEVFGHEHIDHCIDAIRQSLTCNADIATLTWLWKPERGRLEPQATTLHRCKKFDKIQEWAREHSVHAHFDDRFREMNDPLDPSTWT